jgi:hypothetical protein
VNELQQTFTPSHEAFQPIELFQPPNRTIS